MTISTQCERLAAFPPDEVRAALERVCTHPDFQASPKITRLLRFLVEAELAGRAGSLKGYTIGLEVFDRPAGFDPDTDSIVRVNAARLRTMLAAYYAGIGRADTLRIALPKGAYRTAFIKPAVEDTPERGHILLAVERLEWRGSSDTEAYLAAGLSDELVATLSGYGDGLTVVRAPTHSLAMPSSRELGRHGLAYHLNGSLCAEGEDLRIALRLVGAADGEVAWSRKFRYPLSSPNLFDCLEEVSREVAATVLDPHGVLYQSVKRKRAPLPASHLAVFRYHEYQECFSPEAHLRARESLEQAVRQDPGYADAWAALAVVYLGEALFGFNRTGSPPELAARCREMARQAVAREVRNVMANYVLAMSAFYCKDRAQFLAEAENAERLAPHRPDNLAVIGMHRLLAGQWEAGLAMVTEAMRLNPFHPPWHHLSLSLSHLHFRRYGEALAALGRFAGLDFVPFQINLAVIHGHLGNLAESGRHLERIFALWPEARHEMRDILDFWFPFEDLAEVFAEGLTKGGFQLPEGSAGPLRRCDGSGRARADPVWC
ncbi:hypothetical protein ACW73L_15880 [Methylolobus aquaticus]